MLVVRFGGHLGGALGACWRLEGYFGRSVGALGLLGETVGAPLGASGSSSEASGVPGETLDGPWASFRAPKLGGYGSFWRHLCLFSGVLGLRVVGIVVNR